MKSSTAIPLVSVILPCFNSERFIKQAIQSIINQTCQSFELLLIDDGSTDDTWQIIQRYKESFPEKITLLKHKQNLGIVASLNLGIKKSKGIFLARMDADDIAEPTRLEKQLDYMTNHPEYVVCGTQANLFDENQRLIGERTYPCSNEDIKRHILNSNPFCHSSVMIRKKTLIENDIMYTSEFSRAEDYHLWLRLAPYGHFANLNGSLIQFRFWKNSIRSQFCKEMLLDTIRLKWRYRRYAHLKAWIIFSFEVLSCVLPQNWVLFLYKRRFKIKS